MEQYIVDDEVTYEFDDIIEELEQSNYVESFN